MSTMTLDRPAAQIANTTALAVAAIALKAIPQNVPAVVPVYKSAEYTHLEGEVLEQLDVIRTAMYDEERVLDTAVNRSQPYTEKGSSARNAQIEFRYRKAENNRAIDVTERTLAVSKLESLLAEAVDESNSVGIRRQIITARYPIRSPKWWDAWPLAVSEEAFALNRRLDAFRDEAIARASSELTPDLVNSVGGFVRVYLDKADNSKTYEVVVEEAIQKQFHILARKNDAEAAEKAAQITRFGELKPISDLPVRRVGNWLGDAMPASAEWATDGSSSFRVPEKHSAVVKNMLSETHHRGRALHETSMDTIIQTALRSAVPATLLGHRVSEKNWSGSKIDVAYFECPQSGEGVEEGYIFSVDAMRLALLIDVTKADAFGYVNAEGKPAQLETLALYRGDSRDIVGFLGRYTGVDVIVRPGE